MSWGPACQAHHLNNGPAQRFDGAGLPRPSDLLARNTWRGIPPHPVQHAVGFRYCES